HIVKTPITPERFELLRTYHDRKYNSLGHRVKFYWTYRSKLIKLLKAHIRIK
ncbi:hypothetical protein LCGC14_2953360, partial [marine sediment metagenome]